MADLQWIGHMRMLYKCFPRAECEVTMIVCWINGLDGGWKLGQGVWQLVEL